MLLHLLIVVRGLVHGHCQFFGFSLSCLLSLTLACSLSLTLSCSLFLSLGPNSASVASSLCSVCDRIFFHFAVGWDVHLLVDYCSGGSLAKRVVYGGRVMSWPEKASYARDIAAAMEHIHGLRVMHRDLTSMVGTRLLDLETVCSLG